MRRLISFILVMIMCVSLLGTSAYAGLDMSSFEAFKAQAMGQTAPNAVSYTMYFNYPVTVQAVAVLPAERSQQGFDFRLCVAEMCYTLD